MTEETVTGTETIPAVVIERPDWLPEKFKTGADLAKSYSELEKKFSTAPDPYDLGKSKFLDDQYGPIQDFMSFAREKKVPKEVMDKMVESIDKYMDEFSVDYTEEVKKLGDNAEERIKLLDNWAQANLSRDAYEALTGSLNNANAIKALEEIRGKMMNSNTVIPNGNDASANNAASLDDIKGEIVNNLEKYKTDPKYRADVQNRLALASKNSGFVDKQGF
jgi:hypothetical protein